MSACEQIVKYLFYISILTTSFDVFLVLNVGANIRICQMVLIIPFAYILYKIKKKDKIYIPIGFKYLLLWSFFIILFILNTEYISRSMGYALWLMFSIYLIFFTVNFFDTKKKMINLLKIYIVSFFVVAVFGLLQFCLPFISVDPPLVTQWWIPGILPRINGFSYEPSYFSSYLLIGWTVNYFLIKSKNNCVFKYSLLKKIFIIETIVLVLCTSRMGWILMIVVYMGFLIVEFYRGYKSLMEFKINVYKFKKLMLYSIVMLTLSLMSWCFFNPSEFEFLLDGVGVAGRSDHSSEARISGLNNTLQIFIDSPIIGCSLGGVSEVIANNENININDIEDLKKTEGMCVFIEVLAASGIVGIIPFVIYMYQLVKLSIVEKYEEESEILISLGLGLVVELLILQFNQNILRPYLWMHIAILSAAYHVLKSKFNLNMS